MQISSLRQSRELQPASSKKVASRSVLLREIPQLTSDEVAVFAHLEQKAKTMTIDELMKSMGIR